MKGDLVTKGLNDSPVIGQRNRYTKLTEYRLSVSVRFRHEEPAGPVDNAAADDVRLPAAAVRLAPLGDAAARLLGAVPHHLGGESPLEVFLGRDIV